MANPLFAYWFTDANDLMVIAKQIGDLYALDELEKHQQPNGEWIADANGMMSLSRNFDSDRCVLQLATAEPPQDVIASLTKSLDQEVMWGEIRPTNSGYAFMAMNG